jgi:RNA polymerase sigma-70 factor (ECF subfamily)
MREMGQPWVEALYRRYGPLVFRRARMLLGSDEAAWDVVQEVFVRALRARDGFRNDASQTTWLYRITTNYCFNVTRDRTRRQARLAERPAEPAAPSAAAGAGQETQLLLAEILEKIPVELCEVAVYYYVDQMNQDEIAATVGTSRKTVGNRLREFRARAQTLLEPESEASA